MAYLDETYPATGSSALTNCWRKCLRCWRRSGRDWCFAVCAGRFSRSGRAVSGLLFAFMLLSSVAARAEFCTINISTDPPGAEVYLDGKRRGKSPVSYMHGHPAKFRVKLVKKGYQTWDKDVTLGMSQVLQHHVVLKPLQKKTGEKEQQHAGNK